MKKSCLPIFLFFFLSLTFIQTYAQDIEVLRGDSVIYGDPGVSELVLYAHVVNISSADQTIFLVRTINDLPANWTSSLCFDVNCYPPFTDSVTTTEPIHPNDTVEVSVHFYPDMITPGTGQVQIQIGTMHTPSVRTTMNLIASTEPLPVELTSFSSTTSSNGITLLWSTASEINNHGFKVERSSDGNIFLNVGFVNGAGTSTEAHNYSFTDKFDNNVNGTLYYRLKQVDFEGQCNYSQILTVKFNVPVHFSLDQNYPNPFNPSTTIKYSVPQNGPVTIDLYDITGREVSTLVNEVKSVGSYELKVNAVNLASGVYFYRMTAKDFVSVKKMSILR